MVFGLTSKQPHFRLDRSPPLEAQDHPVAEPLLAPTEAQETDTAPQPTAGNPARRAESQSAEQQLRDHFLSRILSTPAPAASASVAQTAVANAQALPGFEELEASEQRQLRALLGGETNPISHNAREAFGRMSATLEGKSAEDQADAMRDFMKEATYLPELTLQALPYDHDFDTSGVSFSEATETEFDFQYGGMQEALSYQMTVGERTFEVVMPRELAEGFQNRHVPSLESIGGAIARLDPESLADMPDQVVVSPAPPPNENPSAEAKRGGPMVLYPTLAPRGGPELFGTIQHEVGHFDNFEALGDLEEAAASEDYAATNWGRWQAAMFGDGLQPSRYAHKDMMENYAETYNLYMGSRGTPAAQEYREMFPARFGLLDEFVPQ